ncbi:hypothetical protein Hanom_Chr07g00642231 [Helianthus anomalus]
MTNKRNLPGCFNILTKKGLQWYIDSYAIPASLNPVLPEKDTPIYPFVPRKIGVYTRHFDYCNYRLPLTKFLIEVFLFHEVHLTQMNPFGLAKVCHFELACRGLGSDLDLDVLRAFYRLNRPGICYTFKVRDKTSCCYTWITTNIKDWKDHFFLVDDRCVPEFMTWRLKKSRLPPPLPEDIEFNKDLYANLIKEAGRIQKYPEHILVMGRISTIWAEPEWYPTLKWNKEAMGLKEALRLKSFDSKELDIRATKTPKGDPPYLSVVQENLYQIRKPEAPNNQGGLAGQGSSGVHSEEGAEGDDDGGEERPQASFKRRRATSSEPDLSLRLVKMKKLDFLTITLDDDEVDQTTGFSDAGILLENLNAHLHGGRTPRDCPVNIPSSPLSFGGPTTKVIEGARMSDPLSLKRIEHSPSGKPTTGFASNVSRPSPQPIDGGDSASSSPLWYKAEATFLYRELGLGNIGDMDPARALEKYIPEWSLTNKAKMALFHLGTPAEHAHYRKMSSPEHGNALMLANLPKLRPAAAYEAQDKALQDLEALKLKFGDLEKTLSDVEKRHLAELKEMQMSYDQLLADHHRLTNDKDEHERARDRAVESHKATIDEAKGMLTRCDGEMVELYAQVSELMLTKQCPKLEKVVADLVNCVNVVGVNEGIKQGFKAAHDSVCSTEEVPGYDVGAQDALNATIKAFDDLHISVLGKVADLVDKPLSVIQQRSKLPIVEEDDNEA